MSDEIMKIKSVRDVRNVFVHLFPIFFGKRGILGVMSFCAYRLEKAHAKEVFKKYIKLNDDYYETKFLFSRGIKLLSFRGYDYFINAYRGEIDTVLIAGYSPQNLYTITFKNEEVELQLPTIYNLLYLTKYRGKNAKVRPIAGHDLVCYFRQANKNSMAITVRKPNITDVPAKQCMLFWAKALSLLAPGSKKTLLYEKESKKYEESAAYLYERLIDEGYSNCFFVISKDSAQTRFIKESYRKNIIWAHSFRHYLEYFRGRSFIGTESLPHLLELRAANQYVARKFTDRKYKFVFLQHGVMYMVSLSSKGRGFFIKGREMPDDAKIVVSSQVEADHFIEYAGFQQDDLYITGLPFYDRTIKKPDADRITIMLTWRPWEYNVLSANYQEANYYKMIRRIVESVPAQHRDRVYLLPHPLITDKLQETDLKELIPQALSYDQVLEETDLLITDYSSIAYSAFYRGSKVIFCFQELEECMEHYQGHLMLNEGNIFGDISLDYEGLGALIENNYLKPQSDTYVQRYRKIVEFHDGQNTQRLMDLLKRDRFISP